jgi:transcriptional regulator with XRE-family HTH domain
MKNYEIMRDARVALGLSLRQLAELTQLKIVRLGEIERGVRKPSVNAWRTIFQQLAVETARRKLPKRLLPLEHEEHAKRAYETYCAAFREQKTLRPKHPGQMPLASWEEQREEIRACWRTVVTFFAANPGEAIK